MKEMKHERGTKKKFESPTGIEPMNPKQRAGALSMSCMTRVLHTARNSNVEVVVVNDNEMNDGEFKAR